nr:enoyl-CoA hydratase-related protein [Pseudoruegeria sp. HB172150]
MVLYEAADGIARIRFNRAGALNALDVELTEAFLLAARRAVEDPKNRVIVVSGTGQAFMAGGDLGYFRHAADPCAALVAVIEPAHGALKLLAASPAIVIASVQGAAAGAGMSIALGADLCVAAEDLSMSFAYPRVGGPGDCGGTWALPRLVGLRRAMEIALLSDRLDAATCLELGLVTRVVTVEALDEETDRLARRIAAGPPLAQGRLKSLLRTALDTPYDAQLDAEAAAFAECAATEDFREAVAAFFDKRRPQFIGC